MSEGIDCFGTGHGLVDFVVQLHGVQMGKNCIQMCLLRGGFVAVPQDSKEL